MLRLRVSIGSMVIVILGACSLGAPTSISGGASVLQGTVMIPAKLAVLVGGGSGPRAYRVLDAAGLTEQPAAGAQVTLLSRYGQTLSSPVTMAADGDGRFHWTHPVPDGLYLVDVHYSKAHLQTFVQLKASAEGTTLINAASTLLTTRIARTKLKLTGLDQTELDSIAAQARGMMLDTDVPDLTSDDQIASGSDTFLANHLVVKQRVDDLLSKLAAMEGMGGDPTATLPGASPTPSPPPSSTSLGPDPTYTPEPLPSPGNVNLNSTSDMQSIATQSLDSAPGWLASEGRDFLWVTCPASNSIMRMDRMFDMWPVSQTQWKHYPISSTIRSEFIPAQITVDSPSGVPTSVWVGNQRADGTKIAHYDLLGNFLGAVAIGPAPSAIAIDTAGANRHLWVGVNGDTSGTVAIVDPSGHLVATGQVAGRPFLFGPYQYNQTTFFGDYMWVATPRTIYRIPTTNIVPPNLVINSPAVGVVSFSGQSNGYLDNDVAAMALDSSGVLWVALQNSTRTKGVLCSINPQDLTISQPIPFDITAPIVSVMLDPLNVSTIRAYVATGHEVLHFNGTNSPQPFSQSAPLLGIFPGTDYSFWGLYDGPPRVLKLAPAQ